MGDLRILLVEDSRADADLTQMLLRDVGSVEHCTSLRSALERLADEALPAPSLVLLDLTLPDSQGLAAIERLVSVQSPPVLVMSGNDDPELARGAVERGARGYVIKGETSAGDLLQLVREASRSAH